MNTSILLPLLLWGAFMVFAARRLLTYLHIFQQEEYNAKRFLPWVVHSRSFDRKLSAVILLLAVAVFVLPAIWLESILIPVFLFFAWRESNPLKAAKKPLVLTSRARRIYGAALLLSALGATSGAGHVPDDMIWLWIVPVQLLPVYLAGAALLLKPLDKRINRGFRREAEEKLKLFDPFIIGITGSYGKTSVKHILGHILQAHAPTLITPGSVNTEMGITRIIRENLEARHKYFVVEMGAYGVGSVARLCALTPPGLGVLSAIGPAHYERFKTLEDTARAKFELAQAVMDTGGGKTIIGAGVLDREYARDFRASHPDSLIVCGNTDEAEYKINAIAQTAQGLRVDIARAGETFTLESPLYGVHHGLNMVLSFAAAESLGLEPRDIITTLRTVPQIAHRLEVRRSGSGITIDDAFNSNPEGFAAALDLLDLLRQDSGGRGILVTPGMVELGAEHDAAHERLGRLAAEKADIVLAICPERIPSFVQACRSNLPSGSMLMEIPDFASAREWMSGNMQAGDVLLLENDLPDLYERRLCL